MRVGAENNDEFAVEIVIDFHLKESYLSRKICIRFGIELTPEA